MARAPVGSGAPAPNGPQPPFTPSAGPVAVQPALPIERPKPAPRLTASKRAAPGDIYCGQCGQANSPERRFCRRCGALLEEAPRPVARLPWWKRIFHRNKAGQAAPGAAGAPAAGAAGGEGASAGAASAPASSGASAASGAPPAKAAGSGSAPAPPKVTPPQPPRPPSGGAGSPSYPPAASHPYPYRPPAAGGGLRPPSGLPPKGHGLRNAILIVLLVVVVVCIVDPSARHALVRAEDRVRYDIIPTYSPVALEKVETTGNGLCPAAGMADNDTVYWYTQPAGAEPERIIVTLAPTFTGTIGRIVFTPLVVSPSLQPGGQTLPSGQASPAPLEIRVSSRPPGAVTVKTLDNPPKLQAISVDIKVAKPSEILIRALSTDAGGVANTCAETGVVLNERKG